MQINISLNKKMLYNFWGTWTCRFSFDWGEKKKWGDGKMRTLVTFDKVKVLIRRRKNSPRPWLMSWVSLEELQPVRSQEKGKWPVLHLSTLYQGTWVWDTELKEITISIFPRQVSLCKVRLVCTLRLNWKQRDFALHVERQEVKKLLFKNWRKINPWRPDW